jgi:ATP:ADP antiporter, AAA family
MTRLVERLFKLHRGDLNQGGPLFVYLFLVIASYVVGKAARSALFLGEYAAVNLPYVTITIALLVGLVIVAYVRVARQTTLRNLLAGSLVLFAFIALVFSYLAHFHPTAWLYPAFYIWVGIYGVLAPAQVWTLANNVLTTREAKRLFGLVGSGAISGFIFGGFLTRLLVSRFGTESVLVGMAILLGLCVPIVLLLFHRRAATVAEIGAEAESDATAAPARGAQEGDLGLLRSLKLVGSTPYLRAIAAVVCLSSLVTTTANWQFEAIVQAWFLMDKNAIAAFLGDFYFYAGLSCLLFQLLMTSRFLRQFGIGPALFVVPLALFGGSVSVLVWGSLWAAVLLRGSDQVLRYSIDKSTVELLYLPVATSLKLSVKSFVDTVIWRLGDGLSGVIVLVSATWAGLSARQMSWLNLVFIFGWMAAAFVARRDYVETLRESIQQHRLDAGRATAAVLDRSTTELVVDRLQATDPQEIVYALSLLEMGRRQATHPAVRGLLEHPSPWVRQRAIALLNRAGDTTVRARVEELLRDPHLEVRTEALLYLAVHTHLDPLTCIEGLGDFADFSIRAALVTFLAHPGPAQNLPAAELVFSRMVAEAGPEGRRVRLEAARLLGHLPDAFPQQVQQLLNDADIEVAREAIQAVGQRRFRRFVFVLLDRLEEPALTEAVGEALASFGDSVLGSLRDHLTDPAVPIETRREIPKVLGRIGNLEAARALHEVLLEPDTQLRFRTIQALNKIHQAHPDVERDTNVIETVLAAEILGHYRSYQILGTLGEVLPEDDHLVNVPRESMEQEMERIFRLLGLLYPRHDLHSAYFGVQSKDPTVHDNALEFLDNILRPQLRTLLVPLLDSAVSVHERVRLAHRMVGARLEGREEAAAALLLSEEPWLKSCGAYAVGVFGLRSLEGELDRCLEHADPLLRETARQAKLRLDPSRGVPRG